MTDQTSQQSSYLRYLPAIYQKTDDGEPSALGKLLLVFEHILTGVGEVEDKEVENSAEGNKDTYRERIFGLEEILDGIRGEDGDYAVSGIWRYFDPGPLAKNDHRAPDEFLPWLAKWVALTLRQDLEYDFQREFIAKAIRLYRKRGTRQGLEEMLRILVKLESENIEIDERERSFTVGKSRLGVDTYISVPPHWFLVKLRLGRGDWHKYQAVKAIIESEKPAHTQYDLIPTGLAFIVGQSKLGVETVLGTSKDDYE
ncbi:MAG: hypothetical protein K8J31_27785 [Anaerolineae bacterium]|nr:hypothetical protein [Anaerolineae bacterium]